MSRLELNKFCVKQLLLRKFISFSKQVYISVVWCLAGNKIQYQYFIMFPIEESLSLSALI